jgi:hypothetical protein
LEVNCGCDETAAIVVGMSAIRGKLGVFVRKKGTILRRLRGEFSSPSDLAHAEERVADKSAAPLSIGSQL